MIAQDVIEDKKVSSEVRTNDGLSVNWVVLAVVIQLLKWVWRFYLKRFSGRLRITSSSSTQISFQSQSTLQLNCFKQQSKNAVVPDTRVDTFCLVGHITVVKVCFILGDCRVEVFFRFSNVVSITLSSSCPCIPGIWTWWSSRGLILWQPMGWVPICCCGFFETIHWE